MPNFINPLGHIPVDTSAFEETVGVKEKIDPELAGVLSDIRRGDCTPFKYTEMDASSYHRSTCKPNPPSAPNDPVVIKMAFAPGLLNKLGVPSHVLKASAFQYANVCNEVNKEFMLCKQEENDPRKCLKYNLKVSDCAESFFKKVTDACSDEIVAFATCLERDPRRSFVYCRQEQVKFDRCMFDKLGIDKRYHAVEMDQTVKTDRPKPKNPYKLKNYDHPKPFMPDWHRPVPKLED